MLLAANESERNIAAPAVSSQQAFLDSNVQLYMQEQRRQKIDMLLMSALDNFKDQPDGPTRLVLSNMIQELSSRNADPDNDFARFSSDLSEMANSLLQLEGYVDKDVLEIARAALQLGDTAKAEEVWANVLSEAQKDPEQFGDTASQAAIQLGNLMISEFRWMEGAHYYRLASEIAPSIPNMSRAGAFLWRIGDYTGAAHFE